MLARFARGAVSARVSGAGRPLVLLHSLLADAGSFATVEPGLAAHFRVVVPDLPGFGDSASVAGGLTAIADRMAEAVRDAAAGDAPLVLGNGFGGFIALEMLIAHQGIAARAVLADCGGAFSEQGRAAFRMMAGAAEAKGLAAVADTAMRRLFALNFQSANPELMAERHAAFLRTDPAVFLAACEALATLDLRPHLPRVRVPALVIVGEEDEATPPAMSRELVDLLPDARLSILPGCAHVPQLQAPDRFLAAVLPFLGES
jgi:3-oxoadipate enol-lactonase